MYASSSRPRNKRQISGANLLMGVRKYPWQEVWGSPDDPGSEEYAAQEGRRRRAKARKTFWQTVIDAWKVQAGCAKCGFRSDRAGFFDLDHVLPVSKASEISKLCQRLNPRNPDHMRQFTEEAKKCQVLCTACHREKTRAENSLHS